MSHPMRVDACLLIKVSNARRWQSGCPSDRGGQRGTVIMGHVIQAGAGRNTARQQVRTTRTHTGDGLGFPATDTRFETVTGNNRPRVIVSMWKKSVASSPQACVRRNGRQLVSMWRGAGPTLPAARIRRIVPASTRWPSPTSSPCTRRCPQPGFSRASRRTRRAPPSPARTIGADQPGGAVRRPHGEAPAARRPCGLAPRRLPRLAGMPGTTTQAIAVTRLPDSPPQVEQVAGVRILQASDVVGESSLEGRVMMAGYACLIRVTCSRTAR
jgi:hypothetical protein